MTKQEIYDKVVSVICERTSFQLSDLSFDTHFQNDLELNSMRLVESIVEVEEIFDIEIPDRKLPQLITIGKLVDFLDEELN